MDERERQMLADRQGLITRGVVDNLPTWHAARVDFLAWLAAEPGAESPSLLDPHELALRRALKVA